MSFPLCYLDTHPTANRFSIANHILDVRAKKRRIRKRMATLGRIMRRPGDISIQMLDEYQDLNEKLRKYKITEAELVYTRNML